MGASSSYLSAPEYGYDYVLAVTQDSINATALAYLSAKLPTVDVCYVYDDKGDPKRIDYAAFKKLAGGTDPFDMPANGPERDGAIGKLDQAGFMFGFQAVMGLPDGFPATGLPDIATLGKAAGDPVEYRLLCRTFLLAELKQIPHKPPVYETYSQPKGPKGEPWVFTYQVNIVQQTVSDLHSIRLMPAFAALSPDVAGILAADPDKFSIRQLLFDFSKAACKVRPEISGVSRRLREKLYEDFSIEYFTQMQAAAPLVVARVPRSNDPMANLQTQFSINPNLAAPKAGCLNYLCASAGHQLPPSKSFPWNWVEPAEAKDFDGVCVINRNQLVGYLRDQLAPYVEQNKWLPDPIIVEVYFDTYRREFGVTPRNRDWHGKSPDNLKIVAESLDVPSNGDLLLHWQFHAKREYDYLSGSSWMLGETAFELKVRRSGNQLIVEQRALVYCKLVLVTFNRHEWNIVDKTVTDTFTLSTTHDGQPAVQRDTKNTDNSSVIGGDFAVPDLKSYFDQVQSAVKGRIESRVVSVPLSFFRNVVFPGGRTFMFKAVTFSDHQDLIAHVTYANPR
jgi:hypothetical protein